MKLQLASLALMFLAAVSARSVSIAEWTFENGQTLARTDSQTSPTVAASMGTGIASGYHASANTDWSAPVGNGSSTSFSANNWAVGDYWQFYVSTLGYKEIALSWDQTRSGTGPLRFDLLYSLDDVTYTLLSDSFAVSAATWNSGNSVAASQFSRSLGSVVAVDDQASVYFRLVVDTAGSAAGGASRIDNFIVSGTEIQRNPVATPDVGGTFLLLSLALGGLVGVHRRGMAH